MSAPQRNQMRRLGWVLVVGGLLVAAAWGGSVWSQAALLDEALAPRLRSPAYRDQDETRRLVAERAALRIWPGVAAGAAVTTFGVALLVVRRPRT